MDTKMITASEARYKALHSKKEQMFSDTIKIIDSFIHAKCMDEHQSIDLKISRST